MVTRYRRRDIPTEQIIINLYNKDLTNNKIASVAKNLCVIHYSKQTINNITDKVISNVVKSLEKWQKLFENIGLRGL